MDQPAKSKSSEAAAAEKPAATSDLEVDQFFTQIQSDMRRPDLSQDAIAAAFQAIQKMALDSGAEEVAQSAVAKGKTFGGNTCHACHAVNSAVSRFCSTCGVPLTKSSEEQPGRAPNAASNASQHPAGEHHYHHHDHHHYFSASSGSGPASIADFRPAISGAVPREPLKPRGVPGAPALSRSEAAVRRMTQDWAQACNTKQLDDLVELYTTDALLLRPNLSPIRGTAAIREFYFAALDAGLGDAEFEPLRVELFGDIAFEAGRCKTLVPIVVGKRREERGKYLIIYARQPAGDWRVLVDCWSSDLSLAVGTEAVAKPGAPAGNPALPRAPRKI